MTTEQKLKLIEEKVLSDAKKKAEDQKKIISERRDGEIAVARKETDDLEHLRLIEGKNAVDAQLSRALSQRMLEQKRGMIQKRDALADSIFEEISQKLVEYTKTDAYTDMLKKLIETHKNILYAGRGIMLIREADRPVIERLLSDAKVNATVVSEPGIVLGGFRVSFAGRLIDETLDEKLRQKREEFISTSGFIID